MRLRLNTRTTIIALLALAFTPCLAAQETVDVSDFQACRAIVGKAERLLCYDTIADGEVFNTERLEQVRRENFGSSERAPDVSVDSLNVTIVKVEKDAAGMLYFFTDDGQAWKQQNRGKYGTPVPFKAELKTGVMGSYFMVNEEGHGIRVKRVK